MALRPLFQANPELVELYPQGKVRIARKGHSCAGWLGREDCPGMIEYQAPYFDALTYEQCRRSNQSPLKFCRVCAGITPINRELDLSDG